eukprot:1074196-Prymnesium_polylepis.1
MQLAECALMRACWRAWWMRGAARFGCAGVGPWGRAGHGGCLVDLLHGACTLGVRRMALQM